jgi:hypothetical protein
MVTPSAWIVSWPRMSLVSMTVPGVVIVMGPS